MKLTDQELALLDQSVDALRERDNLRALLDGVMAISTSPNEEEAKKVRNEHMRKLEVTRSQREAFDSELVLLKAKLIKERQRRAGITS